MDPVILALIVLLLIQQVIFGYTILRLTNRIMVRNYAELVQIEKKPAEKKKTVEPEIDVEALRQAEQVNSLFGMV